MKERPILFSAPMVRAILEGRKTQTRRLITPRPQDHWTLSSVGVLTSSAHRLNGEQVAVFSDGEFCHPYRCPFGQPGDRLWVRETWGYRSRISRSGVPMDQVKIAYAADDSARYIERPAGDWSGIPSQRYQREGESHDDYYGKYLSGWFKQWRPSIHMPRWASRITLEVTGVRVERLQDISEDDAKAEGIVNHRLARNSYAVPGMSDGHYLATAREVFEVLWSSLNGAGSWDANPFVWAVEFRRLP